MPGPDLVRLVQKSSGDSFTEFVSEAIKILGPEALDTIWHDLPKDIRAVRALVADERPVDRALLADDNVDLTAVTVPFSGVRE